MVVACGSRSGTAESRSDGLSAAPVELTWSALAASRHLARPDGRLSSTASSLAGAGERRSSTEIAHVVPAGIVPAVQSYFWTQESPATTPGVRDSHAIAYDSVRGNTVLFSGDVCTTSCVAAPNDTWTWNGTIWTKMTVATSPATRFWSGMTFDSVRKVSVLFGGVSNAGTDFSDTWEWNGSTWTQMSPASNPGARDAFSLAFDSARGVVVLFGGEKCANKLCTSLTNLNDTWEWNGSNWTQMSTSTAPSPRLGMQMAFDAARQVVVLFGGTNCSASCTTVTEYADTWEWNGTTWAQKTPATSPTGRDSYGLAYDSLRGTTILFGGYGSSGDTWEWNGTNWSQVTTSPSPPYRYYAPMVFDTAHGRAVLYGGTTGASDIGDTWEYYAHGSACTAGTQCDTGFCVDGVCCDTASCGTCQSCNTAASAGTCAAVTNAPDPPSCTGTMTCDGTGLCKLVVGQPCPTGNSACANGACVDGYCCSTACAGACDVCSVSLGASADGTCSPAALGYSGNPTCAGGYVCNGTSPTCPTTCSADADCASGSYCAANGTCKAQKAQGGTCSPAAGVDCLQGQCRECTTGSCVDGVCCNSACSGACDVCSAALGASADGTCSTAPAGYAGAPTCSPYACSGTSTSCPSSCAATTDCASGAFCSAGTCQGAETAGQACGSNGACASGFCVDGVCCDGACTGECEACDVEGSAGTCTPVVGSPHGTRPACPVAPANAPCQAAQCDGNTRASCTGFAGSSVTCVQASCTAGVATLPSSCDGLGNCPAPATKQCEPYVCSGTSCLDQCATDADCASGERCDAATGMCVAGVTCDGNHTISGANGEQTDCSPYSCSPAGCLTSCKSLLDCVSPAVCSSASQCVLPSASGANGASGEAAGGCAVSARRSTDDAASRGLGFALLALAGWLRRRRREGHRGASGAR